MKKLLLLLLLPVIGFSQNQYSYGFNSPTATMFGADGWTQTNQSEPLGASTFSVPTAANTAFPTGAQAGGANSYVLVNFNSTTGSGTISNWMISPVITLQNGDVITFYTRTTTPNANPSPANTFPDRLELRLSINGGFSAAPAAGSADVADFTALLVSVNPNLTLTGYPGNWTQFSYTVSGLTGLVDCELGFRYFVTDGGPTGANSNIIAIDTLSVDRPLSTNQFFANNFTLQPNPVNDIFTVSTKNDASIQNIKVTDINGRIVNEINPTISNQVQVNISELNSGVYFVKVQSEGGVGTSKIIKK